MRVNKKQKERVYLDSFRYFCQDFPCGEVHSDESPDFIINSGSRCTGIEITEIYVDDGGKRNSRQGIAATRDRITDIAKNYAIELRIPPASVTLFFNWTLPLLRNDEGRIAQGVAIIVHGNMAPAGQNTELEYRHDSSQPPEVDLILINRSYPDDQHKWNWTEAFDVEKNAIPYVENAIQRKADMLADCLKKCHKCWLLIVSPAPYASGGIRPDATSLTHTYLSPFSRTYLLDDAFGRLHRLNTFQFESSS